MGEDGGGLGIFIQITTVFFSSFFLFEVGSFSVALAIQELVM